LMGTPPTGKHVAFTGITISRCEGGAASWRSGRSRTRSACWAKSALSRKWPRAELSAARR
jgi:hypothetical protein